LREVLRDCEGAFRSRAATPSIRFILLLVTSLLLTSLHAAPEFTVTSVIPAAPDRSVPTAKGSLNLPFNLPQHAVDSPQVITFRVGIPRNSALVPPRPLFIISSVDTVVQRWRPLSTPLTITGPERADGWITLVYNPESSHPRKKNATPRLLLATPLSVDKATQRLLEDRGCTNSVFWITVNIAADGSATLETVQLRGVRSLDQRPRLQVARLPRFPLSLADDAINEGTATVSYTVDSTGQPRALRIVEATAPEFGYAAIQAIALWGYEIPRKNGVPVATTFQTTMRFSRGQATEIATTGPAPAAL